MPVHMSTDGRETSSSPQSIGFFKIVGHHEVPRSKSAVTHVSLYSKRPMKAYLNPVSYAPSCSGNPVYIAHPIIFLGPGGGGQPTQTHLTWALLTLAHFPP